MRSQRPRFDPANTLVVWNRTAGRPRRRRAAETLVRQLERRGYTIMDSLDRGSGPQGRTRAAIAIGGDGTLLGLLGPLPPEVPLAWFPAGTVNLLAQTLHLPSDPGAFLDLIDHGRLAPIRLGRANGRPFASVASAGFDAHVVAETPAGLKRRLGPAAYLLQALRELPRTPLPALRVRIDGEARPGRWCGLIAGRGPYFAGPFEALPGAHPSAPTLSALLLRGARRLDLLRHAAALATGRLPHSRDAVRIEAERAIEVDARPEVPFELDGDPGGTTPLRLELERVARRLLAP